MSTAFVASQTAGLRQSRINANRSARTSVKVQANARVDKFSKSDIIVRFTNAFRMI